MAAGRLERKPRTARRLTVYEHGPLRTPEARLVLILASLTTYALHVVQGRLGGRGQSKANLWIPVLFPVLLAALRALGDAPARALTALAQRRGGAGGRRGHCRRLAGGGPCAGCPEPSRCTGVPPLAQDGTAHRPSPGPSCTDGLV
jgi:hypothetical protein